jgi:hypothetical protein
MLMTRSEPFFLAVFSGDLPTIYRGPEELSFTETLNRLGHFKHMGKLVVR